MENLNTIIAGMESEISTSKKAIEMYPNASGNEYFSGMIAADTAWMNKLKEINESTTINSYCRNLMENVIEISWYVRDFMSISGIKSFPVEKCGFECVNDWIMDKAELFEKMYGDNDWDESDYPGLMDEFCKNEIAGLLWDDLKDVPMNPDTEEIDVDWMIFPEGTHREEIWHWFEDKFDLSVAEDLMYA